MRSVKAFSLLFGMILMGFLVECGGGSGAASPDPAVPPGQPGGYYGSGVNADDLANQVVGWNTAADTCNKAASCRIRAKHTGKLAAIRPKFIWSDVRPGYASGNGGTIQIQIQTDDGTSSHRPSGVVLATLVYDQPVVAGNHFPLLTFSNPAPLVAGQLYHIVYTNVAADPAVNWVSLDHLYMWQGNSPVQPTVPDTDMAMLERTCGGEWVAFATPLTLTAGKGYHLVLQSPSDTVHTAHSLEKGSGKGYKPTTVFADGHAEFNNGNGWVGWDEWGILNRTDNDLQFYFETL